MLLGLLVILSGLFSTEPRSTTALEHVVFKELVVTNTYPQLEFSSPPSGMYWEVLAGSLNAATFPPDQHTIVVMLVHNITNKEIFHSVHIFGGGNSNVYSSHDNHTGASMGSDRTIIVPYGWHLAVRQVSTPSPYAYALRARFMVIVRPVNEKPLFN